MKRLKDRTGNSLKKRIKNPVRAEESKTPLNYRKEGPVTNLSLPIFLCRDALTRLTYGKIEGVGFNANTNRPAILHLALED